MKLRISLLSGIYLLYLSFLSAQTPTVGLLEIDKDQVSEGYILFSSWNASEVYLINTCGQIVHLWDTPQTSSLNMQYLDEEGSLYRLYDDVIEKRSWDNELLWQIFSSEFDLEFHHDFEILPNGNILAIARKSIPYEEATFLGRQNIYVDEPLVLDGIYEFQFGDDQAMNIVWEWNFKDHLVQNYNPNLDNYHEVIQKPRRFDINAAGNSLTDNDDLLHCNGINYNAEFNQIIFSSRHTSEIYIIDHSTSTEEARDSLGGNYGFGGDFLWRWGNPQIYGHADSLQLLFKQHDPNWIPSFQIDGNKISVFNNEAWREEMTELFSAINIVDLDPDQDGVYALDENQQFLPKSYEQSIYNIEADIYSPIMSGGHSMSNGNFVLCLGRDGRFFELNRAGEVVWKYRNPLFHNPIPQYNAAIPSATFNIQKYEVDFPGFEGKNLFASGVIEGTNALSEDCFSLTNISSINDQNLQLFPNPSPGEFNLITQENIQGVEIYTLDGKRIQYEKIDQLYRLIDAFKGIYILRIMIEDKIVTKKIMVF